MLCYIEYLNLVSVTMILDTEKRTENFSECGALKFVGPCSAKQYEHFYIQP